MTKKEAFIERFRQRHPECDCTDEEVMYGLMHDDLQSDSRALADYRKRESEMAEMYYSDPRSATFLRSWREGNDPVVELVRRFGPEIREAVDDPEMQERLAEANREYLERVAADHEIAGEFETNLAASVDRLEAMAERDGLSDEQMTEAWEWLRRVTDEGIRGIVTEEAIGMALMALNHERDVAAARRDGEIRGRNAAIDEHLESRSRSTDGTVTRAGAATHRRRRLPPMGVLDSYADYRSVWQNED